VIDVEPIIHSLLFQKDENWKRSRRVLQPVFGHHQVKADIICQTITECADRMIESFSRYGQLQSDGSLVVPFYPRMQAASLDVITRTALNLETDVHDENDSVLISVREYFSEAMNVAVNAATVFPLLRPIMTFINDHLTAGKMTDLAVSLDQML
jgi:cytochrome P450